MTEFKFKKWKQLEFKDKPPKFELTKDTSIFDIMMFTEEQRKEYDEWLKSRKNTKEND